MEEEAGAVEEEAAPRANDRAHDSTSETFGIRSIEWGASFGLRLNGETIELTLTLTPTLTPTPTLTLTLTRQAHQAARRLRAPRQWTARRRHHRPR